MQSSTTEAAQVVPHRFFIVGYNISHSLSPTIHNTGFSELGLPHHYSIFETPEINSSVRQLLCQPDFGGASVTYPHKLQVHPLLDELSESAKALGAVNTVVVEETSLGRKLKGDNTDWSGILKCIQRSNVQDYRRAIVIGAGGAARAAVYALQSMEIQRIMLVNRTRSRAEGIVKDFPTITFDLCDHLAEASNANIIIGCIPANDVTDADIPPHIFGSGPGVIVEMSYRPPMSALMRMGSYQTAWQIFNGVDVLKEQAYTQFELWTGSKAPVSAIEKALGLKTKATI